MPSRATAGRERHQKILVALAEVAEGTTRLCAYEDIVVRAWMLYPQEFGLRGYVERYPDSSDLHKPLYGPLKRDGYVRVQNKKFGLTDAGLGVVRSLRASPEALSGGRIRRDQRNEIIRLAGTAAVRLVQTGRAEELVDSDLYEFYGVSARTKPADFVGRLNTIDTAIAAAKQERDPSVDSERLSWVAVARDELRKAHAGLIHELSKVSERVRR